MIGDKRTNSTINHVSTCSIACVAHMSAGTGPKQRAVCQVAMDEEHKPEESILDKEESENSVDWGSDSEVEASAMPKVMRTARHPKICLPVSTYVSYGTPVDLRRWEQAGSTRESINSST